MKHKEPSKQGEGTRAEALLALGEIPDVRGAKINFVPASKYIQTEIGMTQCLVIRKLPESFSPKDGIDGFIDYLLRLAEREKALYYYNREKKHYILIMFPGRPAEPYSVDAFRGSIRELSRMK